MSDFDLEIRALRRAGKFAEAAKVVRHRLAATKPEACESAYELQDLRHLLETMEFVASLSKEDRESCAHADRLQEELESAFGRGAYSQSLQLSLEQLEVRTRLLGEAHLETATSLNQVGFLYRRSGDTISAEQYYRAAFDIRKMVLHEEHEDVAQSLNNLGVLFWERGDFARAEPLLRRAQSIYLTLPIQSDGYSNVIMSMNALGAVLFQRGSYAEAQASFADAVQTCEDLFPENHPFLAESLINLALVLIERSELESASAFVERAFAIRRLLMGDQHPLVAHVLTKRALVLRRRGKSDEAVDVLRQAVAIARLSLSPNHPDLGHHLCHLAQILNDVGDHACSLEAYNEALAIHETSLGLVHPNVIRTKSAMAMIHAVGGRNETAIELLRSASDGYESARVRSGHGVERAGCSSPNGYLALALLHANRFVEAWNALERFLGRVLCDLVVSFDGQDPAPDHEQMEMALRRDAANLERQILTLRDASEQDSKVQARLRSLRTQLLSKQSQIGNLALERAVAGVPFGIERVQRSLNDDEAIIGWLDPPADTPTPWHSWIYVLRRDQPVRWRKVSRQHGRPESSPLEMRRQVYRRPLGRANHSVLAACGARRVVPVRDLLEGVRHLIAIPSGDMLGVPIEAMILPNSGHSVPSYAPTSDDGGMLDYEGHLLGDEFVVSYAVSPTAWTWLRERRPTSPARRDIRCLAVGDPAFTDTPSGPSQGVHDVDVAARDRDIVAHSDGLDNYEMEEGLELELSRSGSARDRIARFGLDRLPGTRVEALRTAKLHGPESKVLVGRDATDRELMRMAEVNELGQYDTIHIATHALVDDERPELSALVFSQVGLPDPVEAALRGTRVYDGTVTAKDIARDWKLDAELVTLSACETGLGRKVPGEGYIGFAHAFLQTGARSLLVSLWNVEDRSTSLLMQRFYENWLGRYEGVRRSGFAPGSRMKKADALQESKRWLRRWQSADGRLPYAHPYYWAGFILIGAPE